MTHVLQTKPLMANNWPFVGTSMTSSLVTSTPQSSHHFWIGLLNGTTLLTRNLTLSAVTNMTTSVWILISPPPVQSKSTWLITSETITGVQSTPAGDRLFQVRPHDEAKFLPEEQARAFHHTTAQLLFLSRVRRDIQTTVAFLTTRVKKPDEDDWGKWKRVLGYLRSTRFLKLTLFAELLTNIVWYVDASHQLHDDCKGHTGPLL